MKELKDYTTDELYNELRRRAYHDDEDVFSIQMWMREDVERCFPRKGDDEIDEFIRENRSSFDDRCTELGWEVMEALDY